MKIHRSLDEWHFDFGLYISEHGQSIAETDCEKLLALIIRWAEEKNYRVGGGFREYTTEEKASFPIRSGTNGA